MKNAITFNPALSVIGFCRKMPIPIFLTKKVSSAAIKDKISLSDECFIHRKITLAPVLVGFVDARDRMPNTETSV